MVTIKHMKNLFDVETFIINKQNVQHDYHLKLNNNYYLMKMINKVNLHHLNNHIHMVILKAIFNNNNNHRNHLERYHTIHINLTVLHKLNQITMVLVPHPLMLYSPGRTEVLLVDQRNKKFNVYVVIFIH